MGLFSWFTGSSKETKSSSNVYTDAGFFGRFFNFGRKYAGVDVDYTTAMRHNDVYSCVRIKAESLGQLPIRLYRSDGIKKIQMHSGREHQIFTVRPNPYQTWQELIEQYVTSMELLGRFAAQVKRNRYGNVYEIVPFRHQANVRSEMNHLGQVYYTYATNDNKGVKTVQTYEPSEIMFIKAFSLDGFTGISTISQCALAIGSAVAGEEHTAALFQNGAMPMGVLQTDGTLDDEEQIQRLRKQWNDLHSGSKNSGKTAILEAGLKYQSLTMSAVDAQLIEQRKFSREQIASMFRVPLSLLQASTGMKYNNVEQTNLSFFRDALMPLAQKLENNVNLILPAGHSIKMDEKVFVRGDRKALVDTVKTEVESGLCSVNEGRVELGRDPIEGGDVFAIKTNNLTFGRYEDLPSMSEQTEDAKPEKPPASDDENENEGTSDDNR